MNTQNQFDVGDILYVQVQYAGCSYHYEFGVVTKITKTGRYRVCFINQIREQINATKDQSGVSPASWTRVKPDISDSGVANKRGDNTLVNKEGLYKSNGVCGGIFKKYDSIMNLSNYFDLGD